MTTTTKHNQQMCNGSDVSRLEHVPYNCTFGALNQGQTLDV
jgi:hypothetical protein